MSEVKVGFISPFQNDPFAIVCQAYKNLFDNPFVAYYDQHTEKEHEEEYGFTHFSDGETPVIIIFAEHPINIQVETFAHELAHVAVGADHGHDEVWKKAFDDIFREYNRLGDELFEERDE